MSAKTQSIAVADTDLPIAHAAEDIKRAIEAHQVVIVAGETGSGKSTQLPKICLELGRGQERLIGCTQPRRIAARSVARRVAEELGTTIGQAVGFQVRFVDRSSPATKVKFMTDGILLAEIHSDRDLKAYDTLIIDEAHERSLNIDFLLGYVKRLLQRRDDLKVIITSATINTDKFSQHFTDAPIIQVEGRSYPVEIEYQPPQESEELSQQVKRAIDRLSRIDPMGDILVFLPGEREIFHVSKWLRRANLKHTEILPLYARLPAQHQDKIFTTGIGRRVVLSTNVAETSLTVPGIRFVIDSGLARISRYTAHSRVLRLPIEPISQAACQQRAGRCGRVGPGVCIRLFDETDFLTRKAYTEPEIQRASLVGVILQMRSLELGEPESFPFLDQPPARLLGEAWQTLFELQAVDEDRRLTEIGKTLARLPMDARFGRMLVEANRRKVLDELLVLVAALSIGDVRDRPMDQQQAADQAHAAFVVPSSDFLTQLKLWSWWQGVRKEHTTNQANKKARAAFLAPNRLYEWSQLYQQLKEIIKQERWISSTKPNQANLDEADAAQVHQSLLSGLLAMVGRLDEQGIYEGVRGHRFRIFPGSVLAKSQPNWVMSAERVDTGQTYARMVAGLNPDWLEEQAKHLTKQRVFDPYWSRRTGRVLGFEQLSLHGLVIVPKRRVHYGPHDPKTARDIFIHHALALGEINFSADFLKQNEDLKALLAQHEHKQRRRDLLASDESVARFFDGDLPQEIYTTKAFVRWHEGLDEEHKQNLLLDQAALLRDESGLASEVAFPDHWQLGDEVYRLSYHFDPGSEDDGVTLDCPLHLVNQLDPARLEWLVPGMIEDKIIALISSLRKSKRRLLVPIKEYARAALEALGNEQNPTGSLLDRLALVLSGMSGLEIQAHDFNLEKLPPHLFMRVRVLGEGNEVLGQSRDVMALKASYSRQARDDFMARQASQWQRDGLNLRDLETLPAQITTAGGHQAWPCWVAQGHRVGIRLFDAPEDASQWHEEGLVTLCREAISDKIKYLRKNLGLSRSAQVAWTTQESVDELVQALIDQLIRVVIREQGGWGIRSKEGVEQCILVLRQQLIERYQAIEERLDRVIVQWHRCLTLAKDLHFAAPKNIDDVLSQIQDLIYPGFIADIEPDRLKDYERYLKALDFRLQSLELDPKKDWDRQQQVAPFWDRYLAYLGEGHWYSEALDAYRWAVEEYRVQLFAQAQGTAQKVSPKRLEALWAEVLAQPTH